MNIKMNPQLMDSLLIITFSRLCLFMEYSTNISRKYFIDLICIVWEFSVLFRFIGFYLIILASIHEENLSMLW